MSTLRVDNLNARTGTTVTVPSGTTFVSSGHIIQVVQTVYATTSSYSVNSSFVSFTGLDTTITPKVSNSKFLIMYNIRLGYGTSGSRRIVLKINGSYYNTISTDAYRASSGSYYVYNSNNLADASIWEHTGEYLFTNSGTSSLTVSFELFGQSPGTIYVNRGSSYDDTDRGRPTSTLTVMEVAP